jgi:hypothetical protein
MIKDKQIWTCTKCGKERQWGLNSPDEDTQRFPRLLCSACNEVTKHTYSHRVPHKWKEAEETEAELEKIHSQWNTENSVELIRALPIFVNNSDRRWNGKPFSQ